jgi:1,4-dihydroxy-2-naphthoate octaprenyltransferase
MQTSTWLHLRIPFSFFLMPVFLFAVGLSTQINWTHTLLCFIVWHLLVYPASNAFNSYYDKDKKSIGGLEKPPPVTPELLFAALLFDLTALVISLFIGWSFALAVLIYGLASKAYSHPGIRIKKYPIGGLLTIGFFQGFLVFIASYQAVSGQNWDFVTADPRALGGAFLSTVLLIGSYPMTQIYQHEEDAERNDMTISRMLGINGTFIFTALVFTLASGGYFWFFHTFYGLAPALAFQLFMIPVLVYFLWWFSRAYTDPSEANFRNTMRLNLLSSVCMNVFFVLLYSLTNQSLVIF